MWHQKEKVDLQYKNFQKKKLKPFDNTDKTDREKIISDKIRRNKIKDRVDKLKQKMKPGLDPTSPKLKRQDLHQIQKDLHQIQKELEKV